jgi:Flp pilus assembly protein TadB
MDEDIKRGLKKIARNTETMLTGSLLRWKYKKEGKKIPNNQELEQQSQLITDQARKIISKRGKNIWNELKRAYKERQKKEGHSD